MIKNCSHLVIATENVKKMTEFSSEVFEVSDDELLDIVSQYSKELGQKIKSRLREILSKSSIKLLKFLLTDKVKHFYIQSMIYIEYS